MNRELKFRAWDNHLEVYYNVFPTGVSREVWDATKDHFRKVEYIEQYTGLKDKNGVEIYEGDIVQRLEPDYSALDPDWDNLPEGWKWPTKAEVSFVKYTEHSFWIDAEFFGYEGEGLWSWGEVEVIGNVHQHPHLLP